MRAEDARFALVEVSVPPGALGIMLDDAGPGGGAILDGFAPVGTNEDEQGAVQSSGRVPVGSSLVAVNEYDLEAERMTFAEIGQVLRDTSHLQRVLRFRVELPQDSSDDDEESDEDEDGDFSEEEDDEDASEEEEEEEDGELLKVDAALGVTVLDSASSSAPNGSTRQNSPSAASNSSSHGSWTPVRTSTTSSPSQKPNKKAGGAPALVPATAIDSAAGRLGAETSLSLSPTSLGTYRPEDSLGATSDPMNNEEESSNQDEGQLIRVDVPAGPLGLNLDGGVLDRAVVLGFVPLRDGEKGPVEIHGGVLPGSRLVHVDERDVTGLTLDEIRVLLGERSTQPRTLEFRLPKVSSQQIARASMSASTRLPSFTALVEDLPRRRKLEVSLIMKYDSATIKRGQCWFMISTAWLARWIEFAAKGGELPGPIANGELLQDGWQSRRHSDEAGRPDVPREGLVLSKDYRGVSPMVWCLFVELHGLGDAPLLPRYLLDIYAASLSETELTSVLQEPRLKATVLANNLRDTCLVRQSK